MTQVLNRPRKRVNSTSDKERAFKVAGGEGFPLCAAPLRSRKFRKHKLTAALNAAAREFIDYCAVRRA